jgi:hypothetical protein
MDYAEVQITSLDKQIVFFKKFDILRNGDYKIYFISII